MSLVVFSAKLPYVAYNRERAAAEVLVHGGWSPEEGCYFLTILNLAGMVMWSSLGHMKVPFQGGPAISHLLSSITPASVQIREATRKADKFGTARLDAVLHLLEIEAPPTFWTLVELRNKLVDYHWGPRGWAARPTKLV